MPKPSLRMVSSGNESQIALFHDSVYAALQTAINAIGGAKRVAAELWPTLSADVAYGRLRHCLQEDRPEKLSPNEVLHIARRAADVGCHAVADYFGRECGYDFTRRDPEEAAKRERKARMAWHAAELQRLANEE
jgi:hypothetical protein